MPHTEPARGLSAPETFFSASLAEADPAIAGAIEAELHRQQHEIELIASENIVSRAVLEAQGSVMTNKYAEGYPGRRYYGGCEHVDVAENLAIERVTRLFNCRFANVQPSSGSQANQAVLLALSKPGDTIMGMSLDAGGHLTHGAAPNLSGKWFKAVQYGVRKQDGRIDIDQVAELAREHRPKILIAGGSAYSRFIEFARFREIADEVGAILFVDMAHFAGLVAGGQHPSPFPHAHVATSTTHKTLRGPRGGLVLTNDEEIAKKINSAVFPGLQGGPLMHVVAAKAVAFGEALRPDFKLYAKNVVENAKALAETLVKGGCEIVSGGTDNHLMLVDLRPKGLTGKAAETALGRAQHHLQQERRPLRSGEADGDLRHPARHAGRHDARLRHRRVPGDRAADHRGAGRAEGERARCERRGGGLGARARRLAHGALPHLPGLIRPMRCPYCGADDTQVKDSRPTEDSAAIRRRRVCVECGGRFTTFERVQLRELTVLKKSGKRVPFERDKLMRSVQVALRKRPVEPERVERMVSGIVRQLESRGEQEIPSEEIGLLIMEGLRNLDDVAYVRFASVYRDFREAKDFEAFVGGLSGDDPGIKKDG